MEVITFKIYLQLYFYLGESMIYLRIILVIICILLGRALIILLFKAWNNKDEI